MKRNIIPYDDYNSVIPPQESGNTSAQSPKHSAATLLGQDGRLSRYMKLEVNFKGKPIPVGGGCYLQTADAFYNGALDEVSRALKASKNDAGVCVIFNDIKYVQAHQA